LLTKEEEELYNSRDPSSGGYNERIDIRSKDVFYRKMYIKYFKWYTFPAK
jgi:hypothetical protein